MPVMSETVFIFFNSIVLLISSGNCWILPLLHLVSDVMCLLTVNVNISTLLATLYVTT